MACHSRIEWLDARGETKPRAYREIEGWENPPGMERYEASSFVEIVASFSRISRAVRRKVYSIDGERLVGGTVSAVHARDI